MKKNKKKQSKDFIGKAIIIIILIIGVFFTYNFVKTALSEDSNILSDQIWCSNCQTYHDRATSDAEQNQKLVWCVNCKTYHAPGQE